MRYASSTPAFQVESQRGVTGSPGTRFDGATIYHPAIAHVMWQRALEPEQQRLDTRFISFFLMAEVLFPYPSSVTLVPSRQPPDVRLHPVARTTSQSSVERNRTAALNLRANWKPWTPLEQRIVAAVADGNLRSAFSRARAPQPSRVLVIASSLFIVNPFAYSGNEASSDGETLLVIAQPYTKHLTNTILAFKNTLDWMISEGDFTELSALVGTESKGPPERRAR